MLCAAEALVAHEATYPSRRDDYGPWFQGWLDMGAAVRVLHLYEGRNLPTPSRKK